MVHILSSFEVWRKITFFKRFSQILKSIEISQLFLVFKVFKRWTLPLQFTFFWVSESSKIIYGKLRMYSVNFLHKKWHTRRLEGKGAISIQKCHFFHKSWEISTFFDKMKGAIKSRQLEDHRRPENHLVYSSNSAF